LIIIKVISFIISYMHTKTQDTDLIILLVNSAVI
jgi:hypothetical protein